MYVSGVDSPPVGWSRKRKKKEKKGSTINVDSVAIGGSRKRNRVRITSAGLPYPTAIGRRNAGFLPPNVTIAEYGVDSSRRFAPLYSPPSPHLLFCCSACTLSAYETRADYIPLEIMRSFASRNVRSFVQKIHCISSRLFEILWAIWRSGSFSEKCHRISQLFDIWCRISW